MNGVRSEAGRREQSAARRLYRFRYFRYFRFFGAAFFAAVFFLACARSLAAARFCVVVDFGLLRTLLAALAAFLPVGISHLPSSFSTIHLAADRLSQTRRDQSSRHTRPGSCSAASVATCHPLTGLGSGLAVGVVGLAKYPEACFRPIPVAPLSLARGPRVVVPRSATCRRGPRRPATRSPSWTVTRQQTPALGATPSQSMAVSSGA